MSCSKISSVEHIEEIAEYDYHPLQKFSKTKRVDGKKRPKNKGKEQEGKERNVERKGGEKEYRCYESNEIRFRLNYGLDCTLLAAR